MSVFELETGDTISAFDAGFHPEAPTAPDTFDTAGPSRFTVWIPSEQVTLNLGQPVHGATGAASGTATENTGAPVLIDRGFVVQTDNHVHLHAFGLPTDPSGAPTGKVSADEKTVVRLGTPATVPAAVTAYPATTPPGGPPPTNAIGSPTQILSGYPFPYNAWDGFAMVTEGAAYHESQQNHLIVSKSADLRLSGQRSVLIGSPGNVHIAADGGNIADVVSNDHGDDMNIAGTGKWVGYQKVEHGFSVALGIASTVLGVTAAIEAIYNIQHGRSPQPGFVGWKPADALDKTGLALGLIAASAGGVGVAFSLMDESASGNVQLYASGGLNAYGSTTATLHAGLLASVSSTAISMVSSVVATSVSSLLITSISANLATMVGGTLSASLSSQLGTVKVNGKKSTEVSSFGKVFVTGKTDVQLNSTDAAVYVHGNTSFYIGAGVGAATDLAAGGVQYAYAPGYGIRGTPQELKIGKMTTANKFVSPNPVDTNQILMNDSGLKLTHDACSIEFKSSGIAVQGTRLQLL